MTYIEEYSSPQNNSGFMLGVNQGFHDSPLPAFAIKNYSDLNTLKPKYRKNDIAIAQDLGLRLGTQILSKGTVGGLTYLGLRGLQHSFVDNTEDNPYDILNAGNINSDQSKLATTIPSIAAAWMASDKMQKYLPGAHKKIFKNSIYK